MCEEFSRERMQFGVTKGKSEIYKKEGSRGMRRRRWKTGWTGLESELGRHKKSFVALLEWPSTYLRSASLFAGLLLLLVLPTYYHLPLLDILGKNDRMLMFLQSAVLLACLFSFSPSLRVPLSQEEL
jgi:hypothetical protein